MNCVRVINGDYRQIQPRKQVMDGPYAKITGGPEDLVIDGTHVRAGEKDVVVTEAGKVVEILRPEDFVAEYKRADGSAIALDDERMIVEAE